MKLRSEYVRAMEERWPTFGLRIKDTTNYTKFDYYLGNKMLKRAGVKTKMHPAMEEEYARCMLDIEYFARKYVKIVTLDDGFVNIEPYDFQVDLWKKFENHRFNIVLCPRQTGKCVEGETEVTIKTITYEGPIQIETLRLIVRLVSERSRGRVSEEQVQRHLRALDGEEAKRAAAVWRGASHLTSELRWIEPSRELDRADDARALACARAPLPHVPEGQQGVALDASGSLHDVDYEGRRQAEDVETLSGSSRAVEPSTQRHEQRSRQPVLREAARRSPQGDAREEAHRGEEASDQRELSPGVGRAEGSDRSTLEHRQSSDAGAEGEPRQRLQREEAVTRARCAEDRPGDGDSTPPSARAHRKFVESYDVTGISAWSDTGWVNVESVHETIAYVEHLVALEDGKQLRCADDHIVIMLDGSERLAKNLRVGDLLSTVDGPREVTIARATGRTVGMFDLTVERQLYYTNGILSHNTVSYVVALLHYIVFNSEKRTVILANKGATARQILNRVQRALETLPFWMQPGVKTFNKSTIEFDTGTSVLAAATSNSSIRGESVNWLILDEFAFVERSAEFMTSTYPTISRGQNTRVTIVSTPNGVANQFFYMWKAATTKDESKRSKFIPTQVHYSVIPGRDEAWKRETISNTNAIQFAQEFECLGGRSTITLRYEEVKCEFTLEEAWRMLKDASGLPDHEGRREAIRWCFDHRSRKSSDGSAQAQREVQPPSVQLDDVIRVGEQGRGAGSGGSLHQLPRDASTGAQCDQDRNWSSWLQEVHHSGLQVQRRVEEEDERKGEGESDPGGRSSQRDKQKGIKQPSDTSAHVRETEEQDLQAAEGNRFGDNETYGRVRLLLEDANERDHAGLRPSRGLVRANESSHQERSSRENANFAENLGVEIQCPDGFRPFYGVQRSRHSQVLVTELADGTEVVSSLNHDFRSFRSPTVRQEIVEREEWLFDPVQVAGDHLFLHDSGCVSHNCSFHGSTNTLLSGEALLALAPSDFVDKSGDGCALVYELPKPEARYVMTVDVAKGRGKDSSAFTVFDVSQYPIRQVMAYNDPMVSPLVLPTEVHRWAKRYNEAFVVIESNDQGASVAQSLCYDLGYDNLFIEDSSRDNGLGVNVDKRVKAIGCSNLKDLVESSKLSIVDSRTIEELGTFVHKGKSYEAELGKHDDMVANSWLFGWFTTTPMFKEVASVGNLRQVMLEQSLVSDDELRGMITLDDGTNPLSMYDYEAIQMLRENGMLAPNANVVSTTNPKSGQRIIVPQQIQKSGDSKQRVLGPDVFEMNPLR